MKRIIPTFIVFVFTLSIFCSCQKAPSKEVVISKNDGSFKEKLDQTSPVQETTPVYVSFDEQFLSTDGSVHFTIDIDGEIPSKVGQVVEVAPHLLTEDDARRAAKALLGDVLLYERRSSSNPQYSKSQYQQKIQRFANYATRDALTELMGADGADTYLEYVKRYIEIWTEKSTTAPDEDTRKLCDWTLKKERYYNDSDVEIGDRSIEDDCDLLIATAEKEGIEYSYSVIRENGPTVKLNKLNLTLTEGLGLYPVDMAIYRAQLCRTGKPTQEQIETVTAKAQSILDEINLGQWNLDEPTVEEKQIGNSTEYRIRITAYPDFNGISVLSGQSAGNLQDAYDATYLMTNADFLFSAYGDIIYFNLESPLDVVEVRNENVMTLSVAELLEKCVHNLSLSDADAYGLPADVRMEMEANSGEKLLCQIALTEAEYGLGRVKVPNSDDHYYYIPVLVLKGIVEYVGANTGTCYYTNHYNSGSGVPALIWLNAVDGSIILQ